MMCKMFINPKTPGHYRYLKWVLYYIPQMGLNGVQFFAIACVPVYTAISNFFEVRVLNATEYKLFSANYFLSTWGA